MAYNKKKIFEDIPILSIEEGLSYFTIKNKFKNEKEFIESFLPNLEQLIKKIYNLDIINIELEKVFNLKESCLPSARIDIYVKTKQNINLFIECKNPNNNQCELNACLGQMLNYQMIIENLAGDYKLILATSIYHFYLLKVIKRFNLNHDILLFNKLTTAFILNSEL